MPLKFDRSSYENVRSLALIEHAQHFIMQSVHPLQNLLQIYLASDTSTVTNLPFITSTLTVELFAPSPHLTKWVTRIQSLIRAKDPGARWAGFCIALKTAGLSRDLLLENAQSWCTYALPQLLVRGADFFLSIPLLTSFFIEGTKPPCCEGHSSIIDFCVPVSAW